MILRTSDFWNQFFPNLTPIRVGWVCMCVCGMVNSLLTGCSCARTKISPKTKVFDRSGCRLWRTNQALSTMLHRRIGSFVMHKFHEAKLWFSSSTSSWHMNRLLILFGSVWKLCQSGLRRLLSTPRFLIPWSTASKTSRCDPWWSNQHSVPGVLPSKKWTKYDRSTNLQSIFNITKATELCDGRHQIMEVVDVISAAFSIGTYYVIKVLAEWEHT